MRPAKFGSWAAERLPAAYAKRAAEWNVIAISDEAQVRYRRRLLGEPGSMLDLEAVLLSIIGEQDDWLVWCERDADQDPVDFGPKRPEEVVAGVRRLVLSEPGAPSFVAWPHGVDLERSIVGGAGHVHDDSRCECYRARDSKVFASWIDFGQFKDRLAVSPFSPVPVAKPYLNVGLTESWHRCVLCQTTWRLVEPDPPYRGTWEPIP
jgi:hypothetical protein